MASLITDDNGLPMPQYQNQADGSFEALGGSNGAINVINRCDAISAAPVCGAKTVTTTAAALFAGAEQLSGRYTMKVYNAGTDPVYWGGDSSVTTGTGMVIPAGSSETFGFHPNSSVPIYFIAASSQPVRVVECK